MPIPRARNPTEETQANNNGGDSGIGHESQSGYEEAREKRIRENLDRMHKLGIMDLSLKLNSVTSTRGRKSFSLKKNADAGACVSASPLPRLGSTRRSSRLQNATPVSYVEEQKERKERSYRDKDIFLEEGVRPEIYTEEHDKLLGDCKMSWDLFKDGYGDDGKRIYDSYNGKTCHQCRQKTLGHRTECSQCNMIQGQFCGDCLFTRYGEHVLEAKQNLDWICPVCRGICNCSLCRKAKGWAPTGYLYRKVASLGFKSVAHYLIKTQQSLPEKSETDPVAKTPVSAKKSLVFPDKEVDDAENLGLSQLQSVEQKDDAIIGEDIKIGIEHCSKNQKMCSSCSSLQASPDSISGRLRQRGKEEKSHKGKELIVAFDETVVVKKTSEIVESEAYTKCSLVATPNSIGARLRQMRREGKSTEGKELIVAFDETMVVEKTSDIGESGACSKTNPFSVATPDSIGARLKQGRMEGKSTEGKELIVAFDETMVLDAEETLETVPYESQACSNKKNSSVATPDSIGGRLRKKRMEGKSSEGKELGVEFDKTVVLVKTLDTVPYESEACSNKKVPSVATPDSIGGRLKKRRLEGKSNEGKELSVEFDETVVLEKTIDIVPFESEAYSDKKLSAAATPDSIAERLRVRRNL